MKLDTPQEVIFFISKLKWLNVQYYHTHYNCQSTKFKNLCKSSSHELNSKLITKLSYSGNEKSSALSISNISNNVQHMQKRVTVVHLLENIKYSLHLWRLLQSNEIWKHPCAYVACVASSSFSAWTYKSRYGIRMKAPSDIRIFCVSRGIGSFCKIFHKYRKGNLKLKPKITKFK